MSPTSEHGRRPRFGLEHNEQDREEPYENRSGGSLRSPSSPSQGRGTDNTGQDRSGYYHSQSRYYQAEQPQYEDADEFSGDHSSNRHPDQRVLSSDDRGMDIDVMEEVTPIESSRDGDTDEMEEIRVLAERYDRTNDAKDFQALAERHGYSFKDADGSWVATPQYLQQQDAAHGRSTNHKRHRDEMALENQFYPPHSRHMGMDERQQQQQQEQEQQEQQYNVEQQS